MDIKIQNKIKELYKDGYSLHKLADTFKVDRTTIKYYLFPERRKAIYKKYYEKNKHKIMRNRRKKLLIKPLKK